MAHFLTRRASPDQSSLNQSTQTVTTALVTQAIIASIEIVAFALLFMHFRKVYEPRTYIPPRGHRAERIPRGYWQWIPAIIRADSRQIIPNNGLDAYMFIRFLSMMLWIFVPFSVVSWIILFPVDAANSGNQLEGISRLTFGNIGKSPQQQKRYAAHLILAWFFTFYLFYLIRREFGNLVTLRNEFLTSREHSSLAQSRTVLLTGIPREYQDFHALKKFAEYLGDVQNIWLVRDLGDELPDYFDRRTAACGKLEGAETNLIKTAIKLRLKAEKKAKKGKGDGPLQADAERDVSIAEQLVPRKKRPTHRVSSIPLPFFGKKVDSIEWAKEEIALCNEKIEEHRAKLTDLKTQGAAFIQFQRQIDAHMFQQCTGHHLPLRMTGRYVEVAPDDVVWANMNINPYQAKVRYFISWAATVGLIILWAFPVGFVALISNVQYLAQKAPWLGWLVNLPVPVNGIIQGALPPIALAVLFLLLPIVLRLLALFEGIPLHSAIERSLMVRYFMFLVIHGFLIVTLASGLIAAIPTIANNPGSAVTLLATQLPLASNFFLTYFVTVGLGGGFGAMLQIVSLILGIVLIVLLGSTPRKIHNFKTKMGNTQWGTLFPNMTLLTVIGLTYSIIAPVINGFAALTFAIFYFAYKYLFIWVYDLPAAGETGGLFFATALQHVFVGLYIEEICLIGLFFLARDVNGDVSALPEAILMIVLLVITVLFHVTMNSAYAPIIRNLPISLAETIDKIQASNADKKTPTTAQTNGNGATAPRGEKTYELDNLRREGSGGAEKEGLLESEGASRLDPNAFDPPALYEQQIPIWVPRDELGIAESEVKSMRSLGIDASCEGATATSKGKITTERSPPEMEWTEEDRIAQEASGM